MTLDEQQAICDAATPGPWHHAVAVVRDDWDRDLLIAEERVPYLNREEIEAGKPSVRTREELQGICEFCATARTAWPARIEECRRLREREAALLEEIERLKEAGKVLARYLEDMDDQGYHPVPIDAQDRAAAKVFYPLWEGE